MVPASRNVCVNTHTCTCWGLGLIFTFSCLKLLGKVQSHPLCTQLRALATASPSPSSRDWVAGFIPLSFTRECLWGEHARTGRCGITSHQ